MYAYPVIHHPPVYLVNLIGADIHLPVVFVRIKRFEFEKVNLYVVLFHHQVSLKIGTAEFAEAKHVHIKITCNLLIVHGQLGADGFEEHTAGVEYYFLTPLPVGHLPQGEYLANKFCTSFQVSSYCCHIFILVAYAH